MHRSLVRISVSNISGDIVHTSGNFVINLRLICKLIAANLQELAAILIEFRGEFVKLSTLHEGTT